MIPVDCPHCSQSFEVEGVVEGDVFQCPHCQASVEVSLESESGFVAAKTPETTPESEPESTPKPKPVPVRPTIRREPEPPPKEEEPKPKPKKRGFLKRAPQKAESSSKLRRPDASNKPGIETPASQSKVGGASMRGRGKGNSMAFVTDPMAGQWSSITAMGPFAALFMGGFLCLAWAVAAFFGVTALVEIGSGHLVGIELDTPLEEALREGIVGNLILFRVLAICIGPPVILIFSWTFLSKFFMKAGDFPSHVFTSGVSLVPLTFLWVVFFLLAKGTVDPLQLGGDAEIWFGRGIGVLAFLLLAHSILLIYASLEHVLVFTPQAAFALTGVIWALAFYGTYLFVYLMDQLGIG